MCQRCRASIGLQSRSTYTTRAVPDDRHPVFQRASHCCTVSACAAGANPVTLAMTAAAVMAAMLLNRMLCFLPCTGGFPDGGYGARRGFQRAFIAPTGCRHRHAVMRIVGHEPPRFRAAGPTRASTARLVEHVRAAGGAEE